MTYFPSDVWKNILDMVPSVANHTAAHRRKVSEYESRNPKVWAFKTQFDVFEDAVFRSYESWEAQPGWRVRRRPFTNADGTVTIYSADIVKRGYDNSEYWECHGYVYDGFRIFALIELIDSERCERGAVGLGAPYPGIDAKTGEVVWCE